MRTCFRTTASSAAAVGPAAPNTAERLANSVSRTTRWSVQSPPRITSLGTPGSGTSEPNCPLPPANWNAVT